MARKNFGNDSHFKTGKPPAEKCPLDKLISDEANAVWTDMLRRVLNQSVKI